VKDTNRGYLLFAFFFGARPHIEVVKRFERCALVHEDIALEPVWKCLGELVLGVRTSGNGDWRGKHEYVVARTNGKGDLQM